MSTDDELEAMLAKIAKGDRRALRGLYDVTSPRLYGLCRAILRDEEHAQEVLVSVYDGIWRSAGYVRANGSSPLVWLLSLARNAAVAQLRGEKAKGQGVGAPAIARRLYETPDSQEAQPPSIYSDQLAVCLAELPAEDAMRLRDIYLKGLSYFDLAEQSGDNPAALRRDVRAGILQVRTCLSR